MYGPKTQEFWAKRHDIPRHLVDTIDWDAQHKALKREPFGKKRWLTKHLCGQCGVGRVLARRKHQSHDCCPRCNAPDESVTHVLQCQALTAKMQWGIAMDTLESWLFNNHTQHDLITAILSRLATWRHDTSKETIAGPKPLRAAIAAQDILGWENFLFGRISKDLSAYH